MEEIIKEKISADHLFYVSLKYTKTCDVIYNLVLRWRHMIELSIEKILRHAKKRKVISSVPSSPLGKVETMKKLFKKHKDVLETLEFYEMFRKIEALKKERVGDFRKNVALVVSYKGKEISLNLERLKEYYDILEKFITSVRQFLSS